MTPPYEQARKEAELDELEHLIQQLEAEKNIAEGKLAQNESQFERENS